MGTLVNNELFTRVISSIVLIPIVLFVIIKGSLLFNLFLIFVLLYLHMNGLKYHQIHHINILEVFF